METKDPWIVAWNDAVAQIRATSPCIRLVDLRGDGEYNLVVVDMLKNLKVYKGTQILWESKLLDIPVSVCAFYSEAMTPATPTIAVASGHHIFMYKNARPYFKFSLPYIEISEEERQVWESLATNQTTHDSAVQILQSLQESGLELSNRSSELLSYDTAGQIMFIEQTRSEPIVQSTQITVMDTLKRSADDPYAVSMIVCGTEHKQLYILDHSGSQIANKIMLPAVPAYITISGFYTIEYRILVACRDGKVYTIKNGDLQGTIIELETQASGLARIDKHIFVGSMDKKVHCFSLKGRKLFTIFLPAHVTNLEAMVMIYSRKFKALIVALDTGEVRLYNGKNVVNVIQTNERIQGVRFGTFGREEGALILNFKSGGINARLLQRRATLDSLQSKEGPPPEQDIPIDVPKKSNLYIEQAEREKSMHSDMYKSYLKDLVSLKLTTANAYVRLKDVVDAPTTYSTQSSNIRLNAWVQGYGPLFTVNLEVECLAKTTLNDVPVTLVYDTKIYKVVGGKTYFPILVPGLKYKAEIAVEYIGETGGSDSIRVIFANRNGSIPLITAVIEMPASELRQDN